MKNNLKLYSLITNKNLRMILIDAIWVYLKKKKKKILPLNYYKFQKEIKF